MMEIWALRAYGDGATHGGLPLNREQRVACERLAQAEIMHYGRRVGYCGTGHDPWASFLCQPQCKLLEAEKVEALEFVRDRLGVPELRLNRQLREMMTRNGKQQRKIPVDR